MTLGAPSQYAATRPRRSAAPAPRGLGGRTRGSRRSRRLPPRRTPTAALRSTSVGPRSRAGPVRLDLPRARARRTPIRRTTRASGRRSRSAAAIVRSSSGGSATGCHTPVFSARHSVARETPATQSSGPPGDVGLLEGGVPGRGRRRRRRRRARHPSPPPLVETSSGGLGPPRPPVARLVVRPRPLGDAHGLARPPGHRLVRRRGGACPRRGARRLVVELSGERRAPPTAVNETYAAPWKRPKAAPAGSCRTE